jgi:hypothetical protein
VRSIAVPTGTRALGVSPDGGSVVAVGDRAIVLSVATGERLVEVPQGALPLGDELTWIAVASEASRIVLAQSTTLVWEPFKSLRVLVDKLHYVHRVAITPDGRFATARGSLASALYDLAGGRTLWSAGHEQVPSLADDGTVVLLRDDTGWTVRTLPALDVVERLEQPTGALARALSVLQADTLAVFREGTDLVIADGPDRLVRVPGAVWQRAQCADRFVISPRGEWLELFDLRARAVHARIACSGLWAVAGGYLATQLGPVAHVIRLAELPPGELVPA